MLCNVTLKCSLLTNVSRCSQTSLLGFRGEWAAASLYPQLLPPALASIQVDGTSFSVKAERMLNVYSAKMKGHAGLQPWSINTHGVKKKKRKRAVYKNILHPAAVRLIVVMRNRKEADCLGALKGGYVRLIQTTAMGRNNDLKCHKNIRSRWTLQGKLHRSHNHLQFTSTRRAEGDSHRRIYQLEINNVGNFCELLVFISYIRSRYASKCQILKK